MVVIGNKSSKKKELFSSKNLRLDQEKKLDNKPVMSPAPNISSSSRSKDLLKNTEIKFNQDNSIDYTVGGKTTRLSKQEYDDLVDLKMGRGGTITSNIKDIQQSEKEKRLVGDIDKKLRGEADVARIQRELLLGDQKPQGNLTLDDLQADRQIAIEQQNGEGLAPNLAKSLGLPRQATLGETAVKGKRVLAGVVDFIRVGITGKKPLKIQQAEQTFNDLNGAITDQISLTEQGLADPLETRQLLDKAMDSIIQLESAQKGMGKENLRYWTDNGAEVEAQIAREKAILEQQLVKLQQAELTNALSNARATYGQ